MRPLSACERTGLTEPDAECPRAHTSNTRTYLRSIKIK